MGGWRTKSRGFLRAFTMAVLLVLPLTIKTMRAQSLLSELEAEHDPIKRSQRALALAEQEFDRARTSYSAGEVKKGDAHLDDMIKLLNACLSALEAARKANLYKQAEIRVATLMRRLQSLVDDLAVDDRGWAEQMLRQLDGIHDKLLAGVMKK